MEDEIEMTWPMPGVAVVRMNRPEAQNALTFGMIDALGQALDRAEAGGCRAMIVTGAGKAFCAGAYIRYFTGPDGELAGSHMAVRDRYVRRIVRVFDRFQDMPFVTIAAINGFAFGGGCELALACDFRIAAASAKIGLTEVTLGAIPGAGGVQHLAKIVGRAKALEIVLLGARLGAQEAHDYGLVSQVAEDDALMTDAQALAARLLQMSPAAVAEAKRAIYRCQTLDTGEAAALALDSVAIAAASDDWAEGMSAFLEKRKPSFCISPDEGR